MPDQRPNEALAIAGVYETTWMEVIHKMDEVYSQLVHDEIVLEEKNAQLEASQQFIVSVLSAMSDVILACNRQGMIEETNTALRELTGLDENSLHGTSIYLLLADALSIERVRRIIEHTSPQLLSEEVEINLIHALHGPMPVDANWSQRLDGGGRHVGYVFVGRPVGEIKRAYRELSQIHDALKRTQQQLLHAEKMASLGRLVAGVAHELNNPISFVLGNVHALKRYSERLALYVATLHAAAPAEHTQALRKKLRIDHILQDLPSLIDGTLEGAQRTTDIVNGLKRFSAVDREEHNLVDLNEIITRAIHWVGKGAAAGFTVNFTPGPTVNVVGNAGKLLQVLMNLIQNALDAINDDSCVAPQLWIASQCSADGVSLFLHDNGSGILPEHLPYLFDPFFSTKPVGKGTGLGLSISYGIIEHHGGRLSARNHVAGGAEFVIELPLALSSL